MARGKPDLMMILGKPKGAPEEDGAPDGDEGDAYSSEAEDKACEELWEAIQSKDYDGFRKALDAWFEAKESQPHEEGP